MIKKRAKEASPFVKQKRVRSRKNIAEVRARGFCENCGNGAGPFEVHHCKRKSQGGGDDVDNLACLCHSCHRAIHDGRLKFSRKNELPSLEVEQVEDTTFIQKKVFDRFSMEA